MSGLFARLARDRRGFSAAEFGLLLPVFLVLLVGIVEIGHLFHQTAAVEKGLRTGALFAARSDYPLTSDAETKARNLVKTGNVDGTTPYLAPGWESTDAALDIETSTTVVGENNVAVYRLSARVPFVPVLPGLLSVLGIGGYEITLDHVQAYVGD